MNKGLFDKARFAMNETMNKIRAFLDDYDFASLPSFLLFMVVVTAGMTVNYFSLVAQGLPELEAFAISMLFEAGIAAWKFQGHRVKNSKAQADAVNVALWVSVLLAGCMLIASLTGRNWGLIVAGMAMAHVVFYLIFDANDDIRNNRRDNKAADNRITQKNISAENAIRQAEADLKIIDKITQELSRLHTQFGHLPASELEFVLEAYRNRLLAEYNASETVQNATKGLADINKDGKIGMRTPASEVKTDFIEGRNDK